MLSNKYYPLILAFACYDSQASIINFDALQPFSNYAPVPAGYGSTPEVSVSYQSLNTDGTVAYSDVLLWNTGYADLNTAAFAHISGTLLRITLTANNVGGLVTLNSFDVGAYPTSTSTLNATDLRVVDGDNNLLVNYAPYLVPGDVAHSFTPNLAAHSISIVLGTNWNLGINNINFTPVPLPAALWLFGSALAGLGFGFRSRQAGAQ